MGKVTEIFTDPLEAIEDAGKKVKQIVTDPLEALEEGVEEAGKTITGGIETGVDIIKGAGELVGGLVGESSKLLDRPLKLAQFFGGSLNDNVFRPFGDVLHGAGEIIQKPIENIIGGGQDILEGVGETAGEIIGGAGDIVGEGLKGATDYLLDPVNELRRFGDRLNINDELLQTRDALGEVLNFFDVGQGFESALEKQARKESDQRLSDERQRLDQAEQERLEATDLEARIAADRRNIESASRTRTTDSTGIGLGEVLRLSPRGSGAGTASNDKLIRALTDFGSVG